MICLACALPFALIAGFYLQQKRNVSFVDSKDGSTTWRLMVWREGFNLLASDPKHLGVGIGMDSIKTHWQEWHLFDDGRQPIGHMHSNLLQFALERGVPTFIAWAIWMFLYVRFLWRKVRQKVADQDWLERGILLGCLGGTVGFLSSGLVHYNWGDSEVVMIFYLLMGLALSIHKFRQIDAQTSFDPLLVKVH
jgi:O-antigen ligase